MVLIFGGMREWTTGLFFVPLERAKERREFSNERNERDLTLPSTILCRYYQFTNREKANHFFNSKYARD